MTRYHRRQNYNHPESEIGYLLRSFPRLSQTFILNEIRALERIGMKLQIFAIINPNEPLIQTEVEQVRAPIHYLSDSKKEFRFSFSRTCATLFLRSPWRYLTTASYILLHKEIDRGYKVDSRFDCFKHAVYLLWLIAEIERQSGRNIRHLHAHFAHDPALIAMLAHRLSGISYSFTTHARDLFQVLPQALEKRVERATGVITCCTANITYLNSILPKKLHGKTKVIYYGVDIDRFYPGAGQSGIHQKKLKQPIILCIGRLVEKKGLHDLISACNLLKCAHYQFRCKIYGDGMLHKELLQAIHQNDLTNEVILAGAATQHDLIPVLHEADIFALTPYITNDADRDGMPNVLLEAMACGLPVVSTSISGVPELIKHNFNGLLVRPRDIKGIANALASLLTDKRKREELGRAAHHTVVNRFSIESSARNLNTFFGNSTGGANA